VSAQTILLEPFQSFLILDSSNLHTL